MIRRFTLFVLAAFLAVCAGQDLAQGIDKLPLDPGQKQALRNSMQKRDYKAAERLLVHQIELTPGSRDLLVFAARLFMLDRDPVNGAIAFAKAEKILPLEPADRFSLAMAYIALRRPKWAREELNNLAGADPRNVGVQYWLARLDYDDRLYDAAVERFDRVVKAEPELARGWDNLALSLEGAGRLDEALQAYRRAVDLNRKAGKPSPWPPLNMAILLTRLNRPSEAEPLLREALRGDPNLAAAHYRLGVALQRQGRLPEAVEALKRAVELDPKDAGPLYPLSQIHRKLGDAVAADAALKKFRALRQESNAAAANAGERQTGSHTAIQQNR